MSELSLYSQKIKSTAQEILSNIDLINILSKYGEVIVGGSLKYDLMWEPDIDICVICDDTRQSSISALKEVIDLRLSQKYEYGDFVRFPRDKRPKSYILNLILPLNDQKWEIEIWFFNKYPEQQLEIDNLVAERLTDETKQTILEMKKRRDESGNSKHQISSTEIYKQVLLVNN